MTLFGIDRLLAEPELRRPLEGKRVQCRGVGYLVDIPALIEQPQKR